MKKVIAVMLLIAMSLSVLLTTVACNTACEHEWDNHGTCTKCGAVDQTKCTEHEYNDRGICKWCGAKDPNFVCKNHQWNSEGICKICGKVRHDHEYNNHGECINKKGECDMPNDPTKCTDHEYVDGVCKYCGKKEDHVHKFDNHGVCDCGLKDPSKCVDHVWNLYGNCEYCGIHNPDFVCTNHVYENGKCKYCGEVEIVDRTISKQVEIKFYSTMGQNLSPTFTTYLEKFNTLYPNIKVTHDSTIGGYDDVRDKIKTEITTGAQPNVAYCYPDHVAAYNTAGVVATLDSYINSKDYVVLPDGTKENIGLSKAQIADFIPGYYSEGQQFGSSKMYTLPFSKSTEVLYYNATFFKDNNIPVPTHWWCSEEVCGNCNTSSMEAVCKKIKELDSTSVPLGYDSEANWFITMCEQLKSPYTAARGQKYKFNNSTNRDFVTRFNGWYQNGWVTTQKLYGAYTSALFIATSGQKSYMSIGSSAGATHQRPAVVTTPEGTEEYPFDVGITSIPQQDASNKKVISQGPSLCMFSNDDKDVELATWLFVKYFTTNVEFQAAFSMKSGYTPVLQSVRNPELAKDNKVIAKYISFLNSANGGDNIAALSTKVCLDQADYYYTSPAFNGSSVARDEVGKLIAQCLPMTGDNLADQISAAFAAAIAECESRG